MVVLVFGLVMTGTRIADILFVVLKLSDLEIFTLSGVAIPSFFALGSRWYVFLVEIEARPR
jgi:hypothetical protein